MTKFDIEAARDYSESLGMIGAGWWRQVAWAHRQGIPAALGLTTRDWVKQFVGGWQQLDVGDRRSALLELTDLNNREAGDVLGVSDETVRQDRAKNLAPDEEATQTDTKDLALPTGRYRTIVIDPPWPMTKIERQTRPHQATERDGEMKPDLAYKTMTLDAIGALPVADLAEPAGTHLYLWTTQRFLPDALGIMAGWGADYQCLLTWVKNVGMVPYSWMYDTEHVLFGRIGSLRLVTRGLRLSFGARAEGHSVKPEKFYAKVLAASPGPRLDMFARARHDGFEPWGDEAPEE